MSRDPLFLAPGVIDGPYRRRSRVRRWLRVLVGWLAAVWDSRLGGGASWL